MRFLATPRGRTGDTLLTCPTQEELADNAVRVARMINMDPGKIYSGIFKPVLDQLDALDRAKLLNSVDAYRQAEGLRPTQDTAQQVTMKDGLRKVRDATGAEIRSLNAGARERWAGR
jgi:hypothetical protein